MDKTKLLFSKEHEWISIEGNIATLGVSDHAQEALGDVVFVEAAEVGDSFETGGVLCTLESTKAASEVYIPFAGTVTDFNTDLEDEPALVNSDPYGKGWLAKVELVGDVDQSSFMSHDAYEQFIAE